MKSRLKKVNGYKSNENISPCEYMLQIELGWINSILSSFDYNSKNRLYSTRLQKILKLDMV